MQQKRQSHEVGIGRKTPGGQTGNGLMAWIHCSCVDCFRLENGAERLLLVVRHLERPGKRYMYFDK